MRTIRYSYVCLWRKAILSRHFLAVNAFFWKFRTSNYNQGFLPGPAPGEGVFSIIDEESHI